MPPAPPSPADPGRRPTTRQIAALAGVSSVTVSLALRHHPRIPAPTRERIERIAAKLGYCPDPNVSKLMFYLRQQRKPRYQSTLCALTTMVANQETPYFKQIVDSARTRAEKLGHGFEIHRIADAATPQPSLGRMLHNRGVEGLLLLPLQTPSDLRRLLDWRWFSVVAATYGVLAPEVHRVVPHQFNNMMVICHELVRQGYRRIGLVLPARHDVTTHHGYTAAVAWQNLFGGTEVVRPLVHEGATPPDAVAWFATEKPDAIIAAGERDCRQIAQQLGLSIPGPVAFAASNRDWRILAGIDERPDEIGAVAVDLLAAKIRSGDKGIPAVPAVTMIEGHWAPGPSARKRRAARR